MDRRGTIELASGRLIRLAHLQMGATYGTWLEGYPTAESNRHLLDQSIRDHSNNPFPGLPVLIPPVESPAPAIDPRHQHLGPPSSLPAIACAGRFTSTEPARSEYADFSGLVVLWFQDDFAFPIDPAVLDQIRRLDWDRHAADLDF